MYIYIYIYMSTIIIGPTGPQGNEGPQGNAGMQGQYGPTGPQGNEGPQGIPGIPGGPTGPKSDKGDTGPTGANGSVGTAGSNGETGPTGANGSVGAAGSNGVTGPTGANGSVGTAGSNGETGPTGANGSVGAAGSNGVTGPTGANGGSNISLITSSEVTALTGTSGVQSMINITINKSGTNIYIARRYNIYKLIIATNIMLWVTGIKNPFDGYSDGTGENAIFNNINGIVIDSTETNLYVTDTNNNRIRKIEISTGTVTTLAGSNTNGDTDGTGSNATFNAPYGITIDSTNTYLYVTTASTTIRKIEISSGVVTTLSAVIGATSKGITIDSTDTNLYITDTSNNKISKIIISSGTVTTIAGSTSGNIDGTGTAALFSLPQGITIDPTNTNLFVGDTGNYKIRMINISTGVVRTIAGSTSGNVNSDGYISQFGNLSGMVINSTGSNLYTIDGTYSIIKSLSLSLENNLITTIGTMGQILYSNRGMYIWVGTKWLGLSYTNLYGYI